MFIPRGKFKKKSSGFTLVELLVTITIFVILTGVVLFSQSRFNSTILLTNLAYDTALTIRQAQTYGINIKNFTTTGINKFTPYGVHFDTSSTANKKSFILFADTSYVDKTNSGDGLYNVNPAISISLSTCQSANGCVNRYNITRNNSILALCTENVPLNQNDCSSGKKVNSLDIVFKRPNPEALIRANDSPTLESDATVILTDVDGTNFRKIKVSENGLIEITH